jgi:hypothetical protein
MPRAARAFVALATAAVVAGGCSWTGESVVNALQEVRDRPGPKPYFVGETFEELPLTAISGREMPLTFIYGDCDPGGGDGGCAPPLEVQIWPIEQRPPGMISEMIECKKVTVRGAPGAFFAGDLDLYVGEQTVVIFADSSRRALRAANALRPVDADQASTGNLPPPTVDAEAGLGHCS